MDVVRASDAALEHAAMPHGHAVPGSKIVESYGLAVPRGFRLFGAVVRIWVRHTLADTVRPVLSDPHEHEFAVVDASEAGFEESDQRQPDQPQVDAFDPHRTM